MRTAMISAFAAALGLISTVNPAAAQSTQNSVPSHVSLLPENPFATKTAPSVTITPMPSNSHNALPANLANVFGPLNDQTKRANPFSDQPRRTLPVQGRLQAEAPTGTCAHILIHRVWSPDSNPMIVRPKGTADSMPNAKGMPPCREDIR